MAVVDADGDGKLDLVTGQGPAGNQLRLYDGQSSQSLASFSPYGQPFADGFFVAGSAWATAGGGVHTLDAGDNHCHNNLVKESEVLDSTFVTLETKFLSPAFLDLCRQEARRMEEDAMSVSAGPFCSRFVHPPGSHRLLRTARATGGRWSGQPRRVN